MNDEKDKFEEFIYNLDRKMWITRGCRYNSDRRLKRKNAFSLTAISFLSLYVLVISILTVIGGDKLSVEQSNYLSIASIVISLFILILSLLETSKEYSIKAERLYACANKINKLMSDLKIAQTIISDQKQLESTVKNINDLYHDIISSYEENHEELDHEKFMIDNRKRKIINKDGKSIQVGEFDIGLLDYIRFYIKYSRHLSLYYLCIFVPIFLLALFLFKNDVFTSILEIFKNYIV